MNNSFLSDKERASIQHIISRYANRGVFQIDTSDPDLAIFYRSQLQLAGIHAQNSPVFIQQWERTCQQQTCIDYIDQASNGSAYPVYGIVRFDSIDGCNYTASALCSLPISATNVTQTLGFFDHQANSVNQVKTAKNYINTSNCIIEAQGVYATTSGASQASEAITVIYTFAQTIGQQTTYGAEIITTQGYPKSINNISPIDLKKNSQIKICLTRQDRDCDYFHDYDGSVRLPITGNVSFFADIDKKYGLPLSTYNVIHLIRQRAGGTPIAPAEGVTIFNHPKTKVEGADISWDMDWLKFNPVDFYSGEHIYYVFKMIVSVAGKNILCIITNAPTSIEPEQPLLNTVTIKPMQIVYGCLGEESLVLMANGQQKRIADIQPGDEVRSQDERQLRVEDVIRGNESRYIKIDFIDNHQQHHTLLASEGHPFCTTDGVKMAQELTLESKLLAIDGEYYIHSLQVQEERLEVYNLHLSTNDPIAERLEGRSTLYANGVLTGDIQMQYVCEEARNQRPRNLLDKLPTAWHQDFLNDLATTEK